MTKPTQTNAALTATTNTSSELIPLWLLAELSYACPLQCAYCSNPIDYTSSRANELSTQQWLDLLTQARTLGAVQLGLSGGEPLVRKDLEQIVQHAQQLGFYTNLITSTLGATTDRLRSLKEAGLDHIQISFQGATDTVNDYFAGTTCFEHKVAMTKTAKQLALPLVLNFVLHRHNIHQVPQMLTMALELGADYVELANTQYYGWGLHNREQLLPTRKQVDMAKQHTQQFRQQHGENMPVLFVIPDYFATRPKPCCNGWATTFITITPDGIALPCHSARDIPELEFPNVTQHSLQWIWQQSPAFNAFRGDDWMQEPCRSCPDKQHDYGGCRCQAHLLTGDARNTDPVCDLSPHHHYITETIAQAEAAATEHTEQVLVLRNPGNSKRLSIGKEP